MEAPSATRGLAMTCTRFSRLYTIRLYETRAEEIQFRSSEMSVVFFNNTHIRKFNTKQLPYPHIES